MLKPEQIDELKKPLDWSRVKEREGGGNRMLSYIEGYDAIDTANRIFGYGQWGFKALEVQFYPLTELSGEVKGGYYAARVELTVNDCLPVVEEGMGEVSGNSMTRFAEHEKARKGAITDALKRCLRAFGEQFGNSLYDKEEVRERKAEAKAGSPVKLVPRPGVDWQAFKDRYSAATTMRGIETIDSELKALNLPASGEKTALWKHRESCVARIQEVQKAERAGRYK